MVQPTHRPCGNPWSEEIYGGLGEKVTSLPIRNDRVGTERGKGMYRKRQGSQIRKRDSDGTLVAFIM
ncbi:hypothetical protein Taro_014595 [Colocasia esculenta]|uniref:Uncharacterized protein n=1 Tax=Colocasia esculenta TaxID=4460 RepID=A0A843U9G1_COLES|nr:hypothetical protein [Colocasia esculenta]